MSAYLIYALCTVCAAFLLYAFMMRKQESAAAAAALPLAVILGLILSKLVYVVLMQYEDIILYGDWEVLWDLRPRTFSFVGGAVGACLGVWLAAKLTRVKTAEAMNAFAVPGTLLVAGFRLAEIELGLLGTGRFIETTPDTSYLILAVYNQYGEPLTAVFIWEALTALVIGSIALSQQRAGKPHVFEWTVVGLCVCQILLESLRTQGMRWGFVCVEQLLCGVILMIMTLRACVLSERETVVRRFLPAFILLLLMGAVVLAEFLRQRIGSEFMVNYGAYLLMAVLLVGMLLVYRNLVAHRRADRTKTGETV